MKIRKTFVGNLPDNKIVNSNSTSETDTYSCKYLNERNVIVSSEEPTTGEEVWLERGKNLINPKTLLNGYDLSNGNVVTSSGWFVTPFIGVEENYSYYMSGFKNGDGNELFYKCFYDKDYTFISVNRDNPTIIPSGTKYVRLCGHIENSSNLLFIQSDVAIDYEPYIDKKIHTKNDNGVYEEFYSEENREVKKGRLNITVMPTSEISSSYQNQVTIIEGNITTTGGDLLIMLSVGKFKTSSGNSYITAFVNENNVGRIIGSSKGEYSSESGTDIVTNISAGTHKISMKLAPNAGYTAYVGSFNQITLTVIEL